MSIVWICGVDEAGRGPLVGAVVAGAVVLDPHNPINGLKDSKKLTAARREFLYQQIMEKAKAWGIGEASPAEIDEINILQATMLAMRRAVEDLSSRLGQWHMGYPTEAHFAALKQYGACEQHRRSFSPVRKVLEMNAS